MGHVVVDSLGKRYKLYPSKRAQLLEWLSGGRRVGHVAHWVLRDVSFEVPAGGALGIIGMNGAGKSTLLRILAGTTQASAGRFRIDGQVAALLELGLGFHHEFTGRQNAWLSCQLMGMDRAAIEAVLPAVHAFSELGDAFEHPVRTYSTGMHVRLAFSVATAVRPQVLIVDEALAVGDLHFQHKSIARIRELREQGTTLLLVTHDPGAAKALCDRVLLLDQGRVLQEGPPDLVLDYYNALIAEKDAEQIRQHESAGRRVTTRSGNRAAEVVSVALLDAAGRPRQVVRSGETVQLRYHIRVNQPMTLPTIGFLIRNRVGLDVFGTNSLHLGVAPRECAAGEELIATFEVGMRLGRGSYSVSVALHRGRAHVEANYDWWDQAVAFEVAPGDGFEFIGVAALPARVTVGTAAEQSAAAGGST